MHFPEKAGIIFARPVWGVILIDKPPAGGGYQPEQGDIVVLNKTTADLPGWDGTRAIVKRVIAVGGQTVDIDYSTGTVYVD